MHGFTFCEWKLEYNANKNLVTTVCVWVYDDVLATFVVFIIVIMRVNKIE